LKSTEDSWIQEIIIAEFVLNNSWFAWRGSHRDPWSFLWLS